MNWKMVKRETTPMVLGMAMIVNLIISVSVALWMGTELQRHNQSSTLAVVTGFIIFLVIGTLLFWISSLILDDDEETRDFKAEKKNRDYSQNRTAYGEIKMLTGVHQGKYFAVADGDLLVMGSDADKCQLIFQSQGINERHCTIQYNAKQQVYLVTDYSRTGIYLDSGERLPYKTEITLPKEIILQLGYSDNFLKLV